MEQISSERTMRRAIGALAVVGFLLALAFAGSTASAAGRSVVRTYLLGTGILCGLAPDACPDIAMADNGDKVELVGQGTFTASAREATGGGTFTHRLADGSTFATGTWDAVALIAFKTYGTTQLPDGTVIEGGLVLIRVAIHPSEFPGVTFGGVLTVGCLVGSPPAGSFEGIHLNVQDTPFNFNKEVSGFTVYLPAA